MSHRIHIGERRWRVDQMMVGFGLGWLIGCGPTVGSSEDSASDGGSATEADSDSASSVSGGDSTGTTEADCPASDLPPPFCHVRIALPHTGTPYLVPSAQGEQLILALSGTTNDTSFELFDLLGDTATVTAVEPSDLNPGGPPHEMVFGDFDGDGSPDVALHTEYDVIPAYRLPSLAPLPILTNDDADPAEHIGRRSPLYALDVDLDGRDELLAHDDGAGEFEVWTLDGVWRRMEPVQVSFCRAEWGVHADVDRDGARDLVLFGGYNCGRDDRSEYDPDIDRVTVLRGRVGASTPVVESVPSGMIAYTIHAGDVDGDGAGDFVLAGGGMELGIVRGAPDGGLTDGIAPRMVGDYDEDGQANQTPAVGDFDGDGIAEVLTSFRMSGSPGHHIGRVIDDTIELVPFDAELRRYRTGDINGDGIDDLIAGEPDGPTIYVSAR